MNSRRTKSSEVGGQIGEIDSYLGYWLRFVSNQVTSVFQQKLSEKGVTVAEWVALRFLYAYAPCSQSKLSEEMGIDKGSISRIADRLEKMGLLKRMEGEDRRAFSIRLTPLGLKLVPELAKIAEENDSFFFDHLTKKEVELMSRILKDLVNRHGLSAKPLD